MSEAAERIWLFHRLFFDPPGRPKDLKCVECKQATSAASLALAGVSLFGAAKTIKKNMYYGAGFLGASLGFTITSALLFRLARDYRVHNQKLIEDNELSIKQKRKEFKETNELSRIGGEKQTS